jgi:hypothetical protein
MATDWSGRTAALTYFEKALKAAKRCNDEDRDHMQEAVNALRRSQDHTAIQTRLNTAMQALREVYEIWAGMEGFESQTAPEAYQRRIIEQMRDAAQRGLGPASTR